MYTRIVIAVFALAVSFSAQAQSTTPLSSSVSNATTSSTSGSYGANQQAITFNSDSGGTLKTAPAIGGSSFYGSFSSDSCMVSGGVGVSIVGFGANAATPIRDTNCDLRRSFERLEQAAASQPKRADQLHQAANDVLCQLGGEVFKAMHNQSLCSDFVVQANGVASTTQTQRADNRVRPSWEGLYSPG